MPNKIETILEEQAILGEGALWCMQRQVLYWVDIMGERVHIHDPATNTHSTINVGQLVGTVVARKSGGVILALKNGFASLDLTSKMLTMLVNPESHLPENRFNDGKCDPAGRFWAGTMSCKEQPGAGSLYRLDTDLGVHKMAEKIGCSNGIVWSHDLRTMYYIDTATLSVEAFDYDNDSGEISNRRTVITVTKEQGYPDGMSIDAEGMLWVAHWGGSSVRRWDPRSGKLLQTIAIPASQVTSCAFGGKNLDQLYITTARIGLNAETLKQQPLAGSLFRVDAGVKGVPSFEFGG